MPRQSRFVRRTLLTGSHHPRLFELSSPMVVQAAVGCAMMLEVRVEPIPSAAWLKVQHPFEAAALAALQPSRLLTAAYLRKHGRGVVLPSCTSRLRSRCTMYNRSCNPPDTVSSR